MILTNDFIRLDLENLRAQTENLSDNYNMYTFFSSCLHKKPVLKKTFDIYVSWKRALKQQKVFLVLIKTSLQLKKT